MPSILTRLKQRYSGLSQISDPDGVRISSKDGAKDKLAAFFYDALAFLLKHANIRFIDAPHWMFDRIGHLASDFDSYIKDHILADKRLRSIILVDGRKPANRALLDYWAQYIFVVENRFACRLLKPFLSRPDVVDSFRVYGSAMREASLTYGIQSRWAGRQPLVRLSADQITRGEQEMRNLGVPEGAWFVCVHARESGFSPGDEHVQFHRNGSIADYFPAMAEIVRRGGWCIRVGDKTMKAFTPTDHVVDYARSASKSEWMDVFLAARCRFFLGNTSGLFSLSGIFGRPSALANMTPLGGAYSFFPNDLSIPRLLKDRSGRVMPFPDAFASEDSELRMPAEFVSRGLTEIHSSPAEIADLAIEMMDRLDGTATYSDEDLRRQAVFRSLVTPRHYAWGASSQIGKDFLRQNQNLLG